MAFVVSNAHRAESALLHPAWRYYTTIWIVRMRESRQMDALGGQRGQGIEDMTRNHDAIGQLVPHFSAFANFATTWVMSSRFGV